MSATPGAGKPSATASLKRLMQLGISILVFLVDCISLQSWLRRRAIVLYYHAIPAQYAGRFRQQMLTLLSRAEAVTLDALLSAAKGKRLVAVTFDDALESFHRNALPVLQQLQVPATVFAVSDALSTRPPWGIQYYLPDERIMTAGLLQALPECICVGSHTRTHRSLPLLSTELAERELAGSRQTLEELLHRPIRFLSFPYGHFNDTILQLCKKAGYERVFSTTPKCVDPCSFVVGRVSADPWDWPLEFHLKVLGAYRWLGLSTTVKSRVEAVFWKKSSTARSSVERTISARGHAPEPVTHENDLGI